MQIFAASKSVKRFTFPDKQIKTKARQSGQFTIAADLKNYCSCKWQAPQAS